MKKIFLFLFFTLFVFASSYNKQALKQIELKNSGEAKKFSFVVMGDNRDGKQILTKIIHKINKDNAVKFVIDNGDLVSDGDRDEFEQYISKIKTCNKPFLSVIGNHELKMFDNKKNYRKLIGKTYFSFSFGNSYFIILDDSNKKSLGKKQRKWLKKELKKSKSYQNRFVFLHVPLYDPRKGAYEKGHSLGRKHAKRLNDMFDKYNVTMIFNSHIHSYFRGFWHKTPYIITGGAGAPLNRTGFYHFVKVIVDGKTVKYKIVKIEPKL